MRSLPTRKKKLAISAITLAAMAALASCDMGMDGTGGAGGGNDSGTMIPGKNYGVPGPARNLLEGTSLSRVNTPGGPKEAKDGMAINWGTEETVREIRSDTTFVLIKGLPAGTELYLLRTNPSEGKIPRQDVQYVSSANNAILGQSEGLADIEGVVLPEGLDTCSVSLPAPRRADPWEPADKKKSASGKT